MCTNRALNLVWVSSFDQSPGYPGLILIFFLKSKWCRFSKTKQKSTGCNQVFDRVLPGQPGRRVTPGFDFLYFFKTRPGSNLGSARS